VTKHQKIVELRTALRDGVPLEYRNTKGEWQLGGWRLASPSTTAAAIKRHPELYRIKK
jgi:hypothetical protein